MVIRFFRSLGFRRIGSTYWFGLACGRDHPSQHLVPDDNYDPPVPQTTAPNSILQSLRRSLVRARDEESLRALEQYLQHAPSTDPRWLATDKDGNTLLHLAGLNSKAASVDWIMKQDFGPQMLEKRNHEGDTPLEAVLVKLEAIRTRETQWFGDITVPVLDEFEEHNDASVLCLARLKDISGMKRPDLARLAGGCTCGQCILGFLSPRMSFALLCEAGTQHDLLSESMIEESGPDWVDFNIGLFRYLPCRVRENLKTNKSIRQGFANLCGHIASCLISKVIPNEANVLSVLGNE